MARVLVSTMLPGPALDLLRSEHDVVVGEAPTGVGHAALLDRIAAFDGLIALLTDRIDEVLLARAPALRVVANCAVGVDNIDLDACRRRGVVVTNTPEVLTEATADFTFALALAACRRIGEGERLVRTGAWRGWSPVELLGVPAFGATLGIVGLGRIGRAVARRAIGFRMRTMYAQPRRVPAEIEAELRATHVELDALLAQSDIVCLCCPLTDATRGLLSSARIAKMKPGSVLVNTARGPIVDEDALAAALERGHLAAAGLDVFEQEPSVSRRLLATERAVLTPHIASADGPTRAAMARLCVEGVMDVLAGREPQHRVA